MVPRVPNTENAPNTIPDDCGFTLLLRMVINYTNAYLRRPWLLTTRYEVMLKHMRPQTPIKRKTWVDSFVPVRIMRAKEMITAMQLPRRTFHLGMRSRRYPFARDSGITRMLLSMMIIEIASLAYACSS